ncbi:MAG: Ig-like domain-containing protein [Coriobacteriia bacterium]|nr:Ig-like domain-containing protein [Coriobacteriia bacterium]
MAKRLLSPQKNKGKKLSVRKKILIILAAILLLALPIFAVANPDVVQSFAVQIQQVFSSDNQAADQPMNAEEGIRHLQVVTGLSVIEASAGNAHSLAILSDGTLWAWGRGDNGQLGTGLTTDALIPTQVGELDSWRSVAAGGSTLSGSHSLAIQSDGTLWAWGRGDNGQLGTGLTTDALIPTQVGDLNSWESISAGDSHSLAIQDDGTLWAWGQGTRGQHGLGSTADVLVPTQVGDLNSWESISAGSLHSLALQSDGTLWSWGWGESGRLGNGPGSASVTVPTQVGDLNSWESISAGGSHSLAIQNDGTLWSWGQGTRGRLGNGSSSGTVTVPTQVGNLSSWKSVSAGGMHSLATQANGTLWAWGGNTNGQLGIGSTVDALAPRQIGNLTTWENFEASSGHSLAIQDDGTLWAWGQGARGRLGLDSTINVLVPSLVMPLLAPEVESVTPAGNAVAAIEASELVITFDQAVNTTVGTVTLTSATTGGNVALGEYLFNAGGDVLTIPIAGAIESSTTYVVTIEDFQIATYRPAVPRQAFISYEHIFTTETPPAPLTVTNVTPSGNRVAVDTEYLLITFSEPVDITSGTQVVVLNGDITLTSGMPGLGAWSNGNTTLAIPLPGLDFATEYEVVIDGFLAAATSAGMSPAAHVHVFRTAPMAQSGLFTKTLEVPEGTTIPSPSFGFNFVPRQVALDDNPTVESRPTSEFENLIAGPQTIGLDASEATTASGTITLVGELDLWALLDGLTFPGAGVFVWDVYEVAGSSGTASPSYMTYDSTRFQIRAWVTYDGLEFIAIHELSYAEGSWTAGEKIDDGIDFLNSYRRIVGSTVDPNNNALEVSKSTLGEFADLSTLFEFTLTLRAHVLAPITDTALGGESGDPAGVPPHLFVPRIVDHAGNPVSRTVAIVGDGSAFTLSFQLAHGEKLVISTLPAGTTFNVVEAAHADFAPSVNVYAGGSRIHSVVGTPGTSLGSEDRTLTDAGRNAADFTNTHQFSPPAGLVIANGYFFILALVALLIVALLMARRRKTIEQMPLN